MISIASMLSTNNSDIADIEDFDEEEIDGNLIIINLYINILGLVKY